MPPVWKPKDPKLLTSWTNTILFMLKKQNKIEEENQMTYWVKFKDKNPTFWRSDSWEVFWNDIKSMIKREPELVLEWILQSRDKK